MRTVNALAYHLFSTNLNVGFSPDAIEAYTEIQGAGGHSAIVRVMRDLGLNIVTLKSGRDVISHTCLSAPEVEPRDITHHYAKAEKRNASTVKVSKAATVAIDAIDRAIAAATASDDYNQTCKLITFEPKDEPVAEVAPKKKSNRKSRSKKDNRVLEMSE